MIKPKIFAHGSYVGQTGYNQHTRDFFRALSNYADIKIRNFTIGNSWKGYNETPHDNEFYFNDVDRKMLYQQILWNTDNTRSDFPIYPDKSKEFFPDLNIVLCETNHHIFYDNYIGPKIAYNVWESTLQPTQFFNKLMEFDELWVPSKWQKEVTIKQGYPENKIKVVPEGVDTSVFFPNPNVKHPLTSDGRFKFFLAGRWDYRKSTKEIIESFLKTFNKDEPVDLIVSVDNPFSNDGFKSTEERLEHYGLNDERIKVLHFPSRTDYIDILKSCNVFLSCARSEGWNLPLIEAMSCGVPSIYSNCSGQLEFAEGRGIPVNIIGELPVSASSYNHFNDNVGNYYEPNFEDLSEKMRFSYEFYNEVKNRCLLESKEIHEKFNWDNVAKIGLETINDFISRKPWTERLTKKNTINVSYLDGPRVEILGDDYQQYFVEFINKETGKVLHSAKITNNMWVACGKKYYIPWQIRVNGEIQSELSLEGKRVLISFESKSVGDTIAWAPYAVDFAKKHNCKVILSTFNSDWFKGLKDYEDIEFLLPGGSTPCEAVYRIGWFRDDNGGWKKFDYYPNQVNLIPLQKTATDILGLEFEEKNYGLNLKIGKRPIKNKYVVFGPEATAGCKEWTYENWVSLSKLIKQLGYDVVVLTRKPYNMYGVKNISGRPLDEVATYLHYADKFIGLGSGLSWINWVLGKYTYMINGFVQEGHEFTNNLTKITNNICIKCWNDPIHVFDAGDWDWCPVYKGTELQHICQKSITSLQVFNILGL